ncbi:MAG: hypothetical protein ACXAC8_01880 [Candidatus Hodarchaeales archaeon]
MTVLQTQKTMVQTICPVCSKDESILLTESELNFAREQHSLITKAISHSEEGHILTLYIDGQGIVRRKYCFDIAENKISSFEGTFPKELDSIFDRMIKNSIKSQ